MAAKHFLRNEAVLVETIQLVDEERVFERMGFSSLFSYCVERLNLSASYSYSFISVARKARLVPLLKEAVTDGTLTVSQAKRIVGVIEPANAKTWIDKAAILKQRELEREVAATLPSPAPKEKLRHVGGQMSELRLVIPEEMRKKLERLREIRGCTMLEAFDFAMEEALKHHDPLLKARRNHGKTKKKPDEPQQSSSRQKTGRTPIPAQVKHDIVLRDEARCAFIRPDGRRCENRRYVQLHHLIQVSHGGENSATNIVTLCSSHHAALHADRQPPLTTASSHTDCGSKRKTE